MVSYDYLNISIVSFSSFAGFTQVSVEKDGMNNLTSTANIREFTLSSCIGLLHLDLDLGSIKMKAKFS